MKVIHSCTSNSFSGLERYVLDLAIWQYRQGKDIELFCREDSELEKNARKQGVPVWTIPSDIKKGPVLWAKIRNQWKQRCDAGPVTLHMHAGGEPWFHLPWLIKRPRNLVKTVLHYHIWINHKKKDPVHRVLFLGIDEIWTSSESARAHLATLLPVARAKIRVVPYGRDVRTLSEAPLPQWRHEKRRALGLSDADTLAICVSRIEPIKGIGELFEAFTRIAEKHPNARLAIVGDVSPSNEEAARFNEALKRRYSALPESVRHRIHFLGYVSDCWPLMAAADFYVLPSYEECMSLAMLDALIIGLPILGTNSGGTPSVARPDETGMLVAPRDASGLARALEAFYSDPGICTKLSPNAKALGRSFDQEEIFSRIWEWYQARPPTTI